MPGMEFVSWQKVPSVSIFGVSPRISNKGLTYHPSLETLGLKMLGIEFCALPPIYRSSPTRLLCPVPAGGGLYYVGPKKEEKREVVVDPERRRQIFLESHFTELGNHLGQKKTVHRIQSRYYWLGIVKDVVDWVSTGWGGSSEVEHTE